MERVRQVARVGPALAVLALAGAGCAGTTKLHTAFADATRAAGFADPAAPPATQMSTTWNPQLAALRDPTRDGQQTLGLTGQVFLLGASNAPTEAAGDVSFVMFDDTPRPPGAAEKTPEMFHFDRATFGLLKTSDRRFGACYAVFLPWPADWGAGVTRVRLGARYKAADGAVDLSAADVRVTLDHAGEGGPARPTGGRAAADMRGVPDFARMMRETEANGYRPATTTAGPVQAAPVSVQAPAAPVSAPVGWQSERITGAAPMAPPSLPPAAPTAGGIAPRNTTNSPFQTEGAWAGPKPETTGRRPPPVVVPDGLRPIIVPPPAGL